jgi:thiol:disulfide interchange protein DsbD
MKNFALKMYGMKKLMSVALFLFASSAVFSQSPVSWLFSSKKISDKVYEIQLVANIQPGWHLYAQNQPKDAIAQPTTFQFKNHPLISFDGKVKETGKLEKYRDETLDVSANQYSNKVVFTQLVKLKGPVKTAVTGKLEYQTCDDKKCLPPKTIPFTIALK